MSNKSLDNAKIKKNDEFYTQYEDIETEVTYFKDQLRDKIIFLPCDTQESNFYKYFKENFSSLDISSLRATHLERESEHSFMVEFDGEKEAIIPLLSNGDFLGEEVQNIISSSDVIVTNPPFSLWKEFIDIIINSNKKFFSLLTKTQLLTKRHSNISKKDCFGLPITLRGQRLFIHLKTNALFILEILFG